MNGAIFGYCGFVPHTPVELAFARAEENDARHSRIRGRIALASRKTQDAKDQSEPMKGANDASTRQINQNW